eukprot:scaffold6_cov330-Pavlova_lutheri.AAC.12
MHTPSQTSTSTTAPSLIRAAVDTSQQKSTCPGESTRFTSALSSGPSLDASLGACKSAMAVDFMVMPRCCSSSRLSKYRSFPAILGWMMPLLAIRLSVSVVLP